MTANIGSRMQAAPICKSSPPAQTTRTSKAAELDFLRQIRWPPMKKPARSIPLPSDACPAANAAAERFVRRGYLAAREMVHRRKTRMQKIVAWNPAKDEPACKCRRGKNSRSSDGDARPAAVSDS